MTKGLTRLGAALLFAAAMASMAPLARADIYSATAEYKKGDYAHALSDYLALAELGQPQAQYNVAAMYRAGRGTEASDIHAYAWAMLAAENGRTGAKELADSIRPQLAPGSEQIARWFTAPYEPAALSERLLPDTSLQTGDAGAVRACTARTTYQRVYPREAAEKGIEGNVFIAFTLMPDGHARLPRAILDVPQGVFGAAARKSLLHDSFARRPGVQPIQCVVYYHFVLSGGTSASNPRVGAYVYRERRSAQAGDPSAQLIYGMLLVGLPQLNETSDAGLPWFVRAAQAGLPLAQFEVGYSLLAGIGCARDPEKALKWLHMAAEQNEPNAEVTLAVGAMKKSPGFGDVSQAKSWLEQAAAQSNQDGELYLSALLAAAPDPGLRQPETALEMLENISDYVEDDPTAIEVRAAAQAAGGDFADAVKSENKAINKARLLGWDLSPLQARLVTYQAGKPWYGDLLDF